MEEIISEYEKFVELFGEKFMQSWFVGSTGYVIIRKTVTYREMYDILYDAHEN